MRNYDLIERAVGTLTYLDSEVIGEGAELYVEFQEMFSHPDDYAFVAWALVNENYEVVHNSDITFVEYIKQDNCVHIKKVNASIYSVDNWHVRAFFLRTKITKEEKNDG